MSLFHHMAPRSLKPAQRIHTLPFRCSGKKVIHIPPSPLFWPAGPSNYFFSRWIVRDGFEFFELCAECQWLHCYTLFNRFLKPVGELRRLVARHCTVQKVLYHSSKKRTIKFQVRTSNSDELVEVCFSIQLVCAHSQKLKGTTMNGNQLNVETGTLSVFSRWTCRFSSQNLSLPHINRKFLLPLHHRPPQIDLRQRKGMTNPLLLKPVLSLRYPFRRH